MYRRDCHWLVATAAPEPEPALEPVVGLQRQLGHECCIDGDMGSVLAAVAAVAGVEVGGYQSSRGRRRCS